VHSGPVWVQTNCQLENSFIAIIKGKNIVFDSFLSSTP